MRGLLMLILGVNTRVLYATRDGAQIRSGRILGSTMVNGMWSTRVDGMWYVEIDRDPDVPGPRGQAYRAWLRDSSLIGIRG